MKSINIKEELLQIAPDDRLESCIQISTLKL